MLKVPIVGYMRCYEELDALYLSGTWLGVAPRADNKNKCSKENIHAQNIISILDPIRYLRSKANETMGLVPNLVFM